MKNSFNSKRFFPFSTPRKIAWILQIIFISILCLFLRVWYLCTIQHDEKVEQSLKPQRRTIIEPAFRGTIRDRFNLPLAVNQINYRISILYKPIREIPNVTWQVNEEGKKFRTSPRYDYIKKLSKFLGERLSIDAIDLEDLVHSTIAISPSGVAYPIKENLSEKEFFELKALEKDWPGLVVECAAKRFYPYQRMAGPVLGYVGSMGREQYLKIRQEIKTLETYLNRLEDPSEEEIHIPEGYRTPEEVQVRLKQLQDRCYRLNDQIGKMGVELIFDEVLRGYYGESSYELDARGNFISKLSDSRSAVPGKRILLTISAELQDYAEKLLAENEKLRDGKSRQYDPILKRKAVQKQPWIKGGAIVVLDPNQGDVLAMASYPRFDPNHLISTHDPLSDTSATRDRIYQTFETNSYLAGLWDGVFALEKEIYSFQKGEYYTETMEVSWDNYLHLILSSTSPVKICLDRIKNVKNAVLSQRAFQAIKDIYNENKAQKVLHDLYSPQIKKNDFILEKKNILDRLTSGLKTHYERLLVLDLCSLAVSESKFSEELLQEVGEQSLSQYRKHNQIAILLLNELKTKSREYFHKQEFRNWREHNQKDFIVQKRKEEKEKKTYSRPYTEYLDKKEKELFDAFWKTHQFPLVLTSFLGYNPFSYLKNQEYAPYVEIATQLFEKHIALKNPPFLQLQDQIQKLGPILSLQYLATFQRYEELDKPLWGYYPSIRREKGVQLQKHLASAFYPVYGFGYANSYAYRQATTLGSIFKLVTAYGFLEQEYRSLIKKSGTITKEALNRFSLIDDKHKDPNSRSWNIGYTVQGKPIPQIYKGGRVPLSTHSKIGKIDLLGAIEASSNPFFSLLAAEGLESPTSLNKYASLFGFGEKSGINLPGEFGGKLPQDIEYNRSGLYAYAIGQHSLLGTPLEIANLFATLSNGGQLLTPKIVRLVAGRDDRTNSEMKDSTQIVTTPTKVRRTIEMPEPIRDLLFDAMTKVVRGKHGTARPLSIRSFINQPQILNDYISLQHEMIGKTGTAEVVEFIDLGSKPQGEIYNHIWFGAIAFDEPLKSGGSYKGKKPELVVVVYLRFGDYGKEAAPLAASMIKKWREIKKKYEVENSSLK